MKDRRRKPATDKAAAPTAAGVALVTPAGKALFLRRAKTSDHPGTWCWPGGAIEAGEQPEDAARRELREETGHAVERAARMTERARAGGFVTFRSTVNNEFLPDLDAEHTAYAWAPLDGPPEPLHPGIAPGILVSVAQDAALAMDRGVVRDRIALVFDRAGTVRSVDQDGRLHVAVCNISKANVCPYKGEEIPGWEELGLDRGKVYKMLRHPDELSRPETVKSANGIQLMSSHVAVDAWNPKEQHVAGSTGTDAEFVAPYLRNSLAIWRQIDIDDVNDRDRCELSCAYHYRPDMTSGNHEGEAYDGVMREILFNHVALVEEGRAGHDVLVADSKEKASMNPAALATRALTIGAIVAYLKPRLAEDAKVKIAPAFDGIPVGKKFDPKLVAKRLGPILKGKMAVDGKMGALAELLDMVSAHEGEIEGDESVSKEQHGAMEAAAHGQSKLGIPAKVGKEYEEKDKGKSFDAAEWMRGKGMSEDDISEYEANSKKAEDGEDPDGEGVKAEGEEEEPELHEETVDKKARDKAARDKAARDKAARDRRGARDEPPPFKGEPKPGGKDEPITKGAMDAALAAQKKLIMDEQRLNAHAVQKARLRVKPVVGDLQMAFDTAEELYCSVIGAHTKIDAKTLKGVPVEALEQMVDMIPRPGRAMANDNRDALAADSSVIADIDKRIPGFSSIRRLG